MKYQGVLNFSNFFLSFSNSIYISGAVHALVPHRSTTQSKSSGIRAFAKYATTKGCVLRQQKLRHGPPDGTAWAAQKCRGTKRRRRIRHRRHPVPAIAAHRTGQRGSGTGRRGRKGGRRSGTGRAIQDFLSGNTGHGHSQKKISG